MHEPIAHVSWSVQASELIQSESGSVEIVARTRLEASSTPCNSQPYLDNGITKSNVIYRKLDSVVKTLWVLGIRFSALPNEWRFDLPLGIGVRIFP
jgi:hypothetical protein